jgi:hypothetical protein
MTRHRRRREGRVGAGVVIMMVLCLGGSAGAAQSPWPTADAPAAHVRPLDARAAATLREGLMRSATLRELVGALEASDLVVYVGVTQMETPGRLNFMAVSVGTRFVRISLDFRVMEPFMIGCLGHELQHALEIAAAPDVRDQAGVERLYQRIGEAASAGGWCTRAAQRAGADVLAEVLAYSGATD